MIPSTCPVCNQKVWNFEYHHCPAHLASRPARDETMAADPKDKSEERKVCMSCFRPLDGPHCQFESVEPAASQSAGVSDDALAKELCDIANAIEIGWDTSVWKRPAIPNELRNIAAALTAERQAHHDELRQRDKDCAGQMVRVNQLRVDAEAKLAAAESKWQTYERDYILPCFNWAKEAGIDLEAAVRDNPGKNCVQLLVASLSKTAESSRAIERQSAVNFQDGIVDFIERANLTEKPVGNIAVALTNRIKRELEAAESTRDAAIARETQQSVSDWATQTFGEAGSNLRVAVRANEEMSELLRALSTDEMHPKAAEEVADIFIVLYRVAQRLGVNVADEIDKKMAINRAREWNLDGTGHGYHK